MPDHRQLQINIRVTDNPMRTIPFLISGTIRRMIIRHDCIGASFHFERVGDDEEMETFWASLPLQASPKIVNLPDGIVLEKDRAWYVIVTGANEGNIQMTLEIEENPENNR